MVGGSHGPLAARRVPTLRMPTVRMGLIRHTDSGAETTRRRLSCCRQMVLRRPSCHPGAVGWLRPPHTQHGVHGSCNVTRDVSRPRARRRHGWWNELPGMRASRMLETLRTTRNKDRESARGSRFPETGAQVLQSVLREPLRG
jgi:hypothetical protein